MTNDGFTHGDKTKPSPYAFLQWKGTNVCMDFHCKCGAHCHFDGYFAYAVKCPHCETVYQMPFNLYPREITRGSDFYDRAITLDPDEDVTP